MSYLSFLLGESLTERSKGAVSRMLMIHSSLQSSMVAIKKINKRSIELTRDIKMELKQVRRREMLVTRSLV